MKTVTTSAHRFGWSLFILLLGLGLSTAVAQPVFTGNATADFTAGGFGPVVTINDAVGDVGFPAPIAGTGWDFQQVYFYYDLPTDVLFVGVDFVNIAGDADADGDPSNTSAGLAGIFGTDVANLGPGEGFVLLLDTNNDATFDVAVGTDFVMDITTFGAFNFAGVAVAPAAVPFGAALPNAVTVTNPSAAFPDLEFTIANFSTLPGFGGTIGTFGINVFAGSSADAGIGEDFTPAPGTSITLSLVDLSLVKTPSNFAPNVGDNVTYTLTVSNAGPDVAQNVVVVDELPAGVTFVSDDGGVTTNLVGTTLTWNVGNLAAGASANLNVVVNVPVAGTFQNCAQVNSFFQGDMITTFINDVDSMPGNGFFNGEDDESCVSITSAVPAPGGGGGVESNGMAAIQLANRFFQRDQKHNASISKREADALQPFTHTGFRSGTIETDGAGELANVLDLIPEAGPHATTAIVTTPTDLLGITNATAVFAVDYIFPSQRRLGAIFAASSPAGELYDHTKQTCDRLAGAVLESLEIVNVQGQPFILSRHRHPGGELDFAISFAAYTGGGFTVDNRWTPNQYTPAGSGDVLNFQVWSALPEVTINLVDDILSNMADHGAVQFDNAPLLPDVYVQSGQYENGRLQLDLVNRAGAQQITIYGNMSAIENGDTTPFETVVSLPQPVSGQDVVSVSVETGPLFDFVFWIKNDQSEAEDQVYFADGVWSYAQPETGAVVHHFETRAEAQIGATDDYVVARTAHLRGQTDSWMSIFRYLKSGGQSVDLSAYKGVQFTAYGRGEVELALQKASIQNHDHYNTTFRLSANPQSYYIDFNTLTRTNGVGGFTADDLYLLAFYLTQDGTDQVEITLDDVRFVGHSITPIDETELPHQIVLEQNYPNPFNPTTAIGFTLPEAAEVHLAVYDLLGRQVRVLANGLHVAGRHTALFDAQGLPSGTYIYRLSTAGQTFSKKFTLMK